MSAAPGPFEQLLEKLTEHGCEPRRFGPGFYGVVRYAAAGSGHDDAVISLALAVYGAQQDSRGKEAQWIPYRRERRWGF